MLGRFCSGLSKLEGKDKVYGKKISEGKRWTERAEKREKGNKWEENGIKNRAKKGVGRTTNREKNKMKIKLCPQMTFPGVSVCLFQ